MADFVFNVAKGRVVELYNRVDTADPANCALVIVPVDVGATSDATLRDFLTLAAVLGGGATERTTGGWGRKTLTGAALAAAAPDLANDRFDVGAGTANQIWAAVTAGAVSDLILCYDNDTTAGTDANLIPLLCYDFAITPDGTDVVAQVNAAGFARAS